MESDEFHARGAPPKGPRDRPATASCVNTAKLVQGSPAQGDLLVEWGNKWWPAEIVKQEGASYFIHYKNYGTNWDEWVTLERLGVYSAAE